MLFSNVTPNAIYISWVYLPFCLPTCILIPSSPYPQPSLPTRLQKCLSLFTCRSVCLSAFPPLSLSVCIRKQVSITRKLHNHYDDETQYTDSHTTARKHSKLISQFSGSFPQQNDCKTTCIKSLRTSPQNKKTIQ